MAASRGHAACKARQRPGKAGSAAVAWLALVLTCVGVSAFAADDDAAQGRRIEQGVRIGAVGSTGWSTGPHLHFEFRVNGAHQDPLKIAKASETLTLPPASKAEFAALARSLQAQLDVADTLLGARGRAE